MTPLPSFTVTARPRIADGTQAGDELREVIPEGATITFESNLPPYQPLPWDGRLAWITSAVAKVDAAGNAVIDGQPVRLLANDPTLGVTGIQWTAVVSLTTGSLMHRMAPIVFDAPNDGATVDLSSVAQVPSADVAAVTGLTLTSLLTLLSDPESAVRTTLDEVYGITATIDGGIP